MDPRDKHHCNPQGANHDLVIQRHGPSQRSNAGCCVLALRIAWGYSLSLLILEIRLTGKRQQQWDRGYESDGDGWGTDYSRVPRLRQPGPEGVHHHSFVVGRPYRSLDDRLPVLEEHPTAPALRHHLCGTISAAATSIRDNGVYFSDLNPGTFYAVDVVVKWRLLNGTEIGSMTMDWNAAGDYICSQSTWRCSTGYVSWGSRDAFITFN